MKLWAVAQQQFGGLLNLTNRVFVAQELQLGCWVSGAWMLPSVLLLLAKEDLTLVSIL